MAGFGVDAFAEGVDSDGEAGAHVAEEDGVDADAGLLHAEEDGDERKVDGAVDVHERGGEGRVGGDRGDEEHLGRHGAAERGGVFGDVVLEGAGLGELGGERGGETHDGRGGLGQALGVAGVFLGGLVDEGSAGGTGGDVGQGVRGVGRVDEIAEQHDVVAHAGEGEVVRGEGAEDGLEIVEVLGER